MSARRPGGFAFIWVTIFLGCTFHVSDNMSVAKNVRDFVDYRGNPKLESLLSKIPVTLPDGTEYDEVNVTLIKVQLCEDKDKELTSLKTQLDQKTRLNSELDGEAVGLRRDVRQLKMRLSTCSSTASAVAGSYQTQLRTKIHQLLDVFDTETFQILKILALTWEVSALQRKVEVASSSTDATEISVLEKQLAEKVAELAERKRQIEGSHSKSALILQIISLQNQVWDLQQTRTESDVYPDSAELDLQTQIDRKISELRGGRGDGGEGDAISAVLELVSVRTKITVMEKLIRVRIQKSRTTSADAERQFRLKLELLKEKILLLNVRENDKELTKEILKIQGELEHLTTLKVTTKETLEAFLRELRVNLEAEKRRWELLLKQLEAADYSAAQMTIKIINIMEELRQQQYTTSTSPTQDIFAVLERYKTDYAKAQAEITNLQQNLQLARRECSGIEERHKLVRTELEQKIAELNRTDADGALVLSVINLQAELMILRKRISSSDNEEEISKLQRELEQKQQELNSKTREVERVITSPQTVLEIIELQREIWSLQNQNTSGTIDAIKVLQNRVDDLIGQIDDKTQAGMKQMMTIVALQTEVDYLKTLLSNVRTLETSRVTELTNQLNSKEDVLKQYVSELNEKNQESAKLTVVITGLQNQLRKIEKDKESEGKTASATISKLREQLRIKEEENGRCQALIKSLQHSLNQTEAECSVHEQKIQGLQTDLDAKIEELTSKSDTVTSLALKISTLTVHLEELNKQLENSVSKSKIDELQRIIAEKSAELSQKTQELKTRSEKAQRILQIVAIQVEIERQVAVNDTDYSRISDLENQIKGLIDGIQDKDDETSKLTFQILSLKDKIARLTKQKETQLQKQVERIRELESKVEDITDQIEEKTKLLDTSGIMVANLNKVTMDPDTAHPRIALSADRTEVYTTEDILSVPDQPGRFDVVLGILGETGFSRGRTYWEVSVAGKSCYHLGMASESAPRKGSLSFKPSKGFWTIVLNKQGELKALDNRPARLNVEVLPLTLGILLDYDKGQISFYDSGARSYLYTFSGQIFFDKIYPFINYCVEDVKIPSAIVLRNPGSTDWIK
ncbi:unnamed protein product [Menidia menidia]|uniref:(Atlantic silverside) hypothetical protein n=1 Tax=Menidia menidia TaxID=238744 RepID=A0A8S4AQ94_9TELE|nr:unnamed protein product [Menidia menidia]